jgi:hypothetical protein
MRVHAHNVLQEIAAERMRQIDEESWTPEHDDEHDDEALSKAAACYALGVTRVYNHRGGRASASLWPWDMRWWKPGDRRRDLVKAAALLVAEIERLDRASANTRVSIQDDGRDD